MSNPALLLRAAHFAAEKHRLQRRKSEPEPDAGDRLRLTPYINHPVDVAHTLATVGGVEDPVALCAALLHDTIEDTNTTVAELREHFGNAITEVVLEVSDDKSLSKEERKQLQIVHAATASKAARLVKLGDKISNVSDLLERPPKGWDLARIQQYFDWSKQVIDALRGTNVALEAAFDDLYAQRP